jgi:hypothetical protein
MTMLHTDVMTSLSYIHVSYTHTQKYTGHEDRRSSSHTSAMIALYMYHSYTHTHTYTGHEDRRSSSHTSVMTALDMDDSYGLGGAAASSYHPDTAVRNRLAMPVMSGDIKPHATCGRAMDGMCMYACVDVCMWGCIKPHAELWMV